MIGIVQNRKIPFIISGLLFIASIILIATLGLKPGIDFTGGSLIEVSFSEKRPEIAEIKQALDPLDLGSIVVQPSNEDGYILKMKFISEEEHQNILASLKERFERNENNEVDQESDIESDIEEETKGVIENKIYEKRVETIGSSISAQLRKKAWYTAVVVILAIIAYVAYAFRKVSKPVKSWKFGITAIIALIHDVVIVMGVFAILGHFWGIEINIPFVVALLTILGYSVNDTIVVFDRVRENIISMGYENFEHTVNKGVNDTLLRSLNTSITTLCVLVALFLFGGETIKYFALALIIGIVSGTYSSIFLASPLLVVWEKLKRVKI